MGATQSLKKAIEEGNLKKSIEAVIMGADLNATDKSGMNLQKYAASRRLTVIAAYLGYVSHFQKAGNDRDKLDSQYDDGYTILTFAAKHCITHLAEDVLEKGGNVNVVDKLGYTALLHACEQNHNIMIEILLKNHANPNCLNNWCQSPLSFCASQRNVIAMQKLLDARADPNTASNTGSTPLMRAAIDGDIQIVKLLLDYGANVHATNSLGETALFLTVEGGYSDVASTLIRAGAQTDLANRSGYTALTMACSKGYRSVADLLIRNGADPNTAALDGTTPLLAAADLLTNGKEVCSMLLNNGADVNYESPHGDTVLLRALGHSDFELAQMLIDRGASISIGHVRGVSTEQHLQSLGITVERCPDGARPARPPSANGEMVRVLYIPMQPIQTYAPPTKQATIAPVNSSVTPSSPQPQQTQPQAHMLHQQHSQAQGSQGPPPVAVPATSQELSRSRRISNSSPLHSALAGGQRKLSDVGITPSSIPTISSQLQSPPKPTLPIMSPTANAINVGSVTTILGSASPQFQSTPMSPPVVPKRPGRPVPPPGGAPGQPPSHYHPHPHHHPPHQPPPPQAAAGYPSMSSPFGQSPPMPPASQPQFPSRPTSAQAHPPAPFAQSPPPPIPPPAVPIASMELTSPPSYPPSFNLQNSPVDDDIPPPPAAPPMDDDIPPPPAAPPMDDDIPPPPAAPPMDDDIPPPPSGAPVVHASEDRTSMNSSIPPTHHSPLKHLPNIDPNILVGPPPALLVTPGTQRKMSSPNITKRPPMVALPSLPPLPVQPTQQPTTQQQPQLGNSPQMVAVKRTSSVPDISENLPPEEMCVHWRGHYDAASSKYYYHNKITGKTTWDKPECITNNPPPCTTCGCDSFVAAQKKISKCTNCKHHHVFGSMRRV